MCRPLVIEVQSLWEAHNLILNHGPPIGEIIWEIFLEIFWEIFLEIFSCQKIISISPTLLLRRKLGFESLMPRFVRHINWSFTEKVI